MKQRDAIVIGGGIIGLSIALELRRQGSEVLLLDRGEPGRESSHAAAGMLAFCDPDTHPLLQDFCFASARLYPEFVKRIEGESGCAVDFRQEGTISFFTEDEAARCATGRELTPDQVRAMEPLLDVPEMRAFHLPESSVDNRALTSAALEACRRTGVEIRPQSEVTEVLAEGGRACGVRTSAEELRSTAVVNCAGAWAGQIGPQITPTRPRKGQMLAVRAADPKQRLLTHVIRTPDVYLVPRSDGRVLIGATVEDAGYDKQVDPAAIRNLYEHAVKVVPELARTSVVETWAGLRPGAKDDLPILGATELPGYFAATGHYRNGILLSAITAKVMAELVLGHAPSFDLSAFSPLRFRT